MINRCFTIVCACLLLVSGCKTMAPEPEARLPVQMPERYANQAGVPVPDQLSGQDKGVSKAPDNWWTALDSRELDRLIQTGLAANYSLKVRQARIDQAAASVDRETAALGVSLNYSLEAAKTHTRVKRSGSGAVMDAGHNWEAYLSGSYTPDVWNKAGTAIRSAALALDAACQDYNATALELTCDIADAWVGIISVRHRKRLLDSQIQVNTNQLDLQKFRFLNGSASALDVSQQRESLAATLAAVPLLEKEEQQLIHELARLVGGIPGQAVVILTRDFPPMDKLPDAGLPAALLENRADIRAARLRLLAAQADVTAARADFLPDFTLSASALFSSGSLDLVFQNWVASLAAGLAGPVLDAGRRRAEVSRTRAVVREHLNLYADAVASAICEVEDRLVGIDRQAVYIDRLSEELETVRLTLKDARIQYLNGQSSYLNYLTAWSSIERLERQLVSEQASLVKERISLQRALGWQDAGVTINLYRSDYEPE